MKRAYFPAAEGLAIAFHAASLGFSFGPGPGADEEPFQTVKLGGKSIAVVSVSGPLTQHPKPVPTLFGAAILFDSYDALAARYAAALESEPDALVLKTDSPGGDALGVFELSRQLAASAEAAGVPVYAYCDGMIASAAYAIACSASGGIYTPEAGMIGSIGVLRGLVSQTRMTKAMGIDLEVVSSGKAKVYGNPDTPITDESRAAAQAQVDELAGMFFSLVEEQRGIAAKAVAGLEGAILSGPQAVKAGLADAVLGWNAFLAMVAKGADDGEPEGATMGMKEMRAELAKMAEGDGEDAAQARKCLAALDDDGDKDKGKKAKAGEDGDDPKKDDKAKAKADDGDKKPIDAKAGGDEPPPKKDDEEDKSKAKASASLDLVARVHALEAERDAAKLAEERRALLDKRPDFSSEVRAQLEDVETPIAFVKKAVETWPKRPFAAAANALTPKATRGKDQTGDGSGSDVPHVDQETADHIARAMGLKAKTEAPVVHERNTMTFGGPATPDQARARLAQLEKGEG